MATTLIDDLFDDANGTNVPSRASAIGGTPQEHSSFTSGGAVTEAGACYPNGTGATVIGWDQNLSDCVAEAVVDKKSSIPTDQYFGIGLRGSLSSVVWYSHGTGKVGGATDYDSFGYSTGDNAGAGGYTQTAVGTGPAAGEILFKMSAVGNYLRGWIGRREVLRCTRTSYSSGRPMLQWGAPGSTTTGFHVKRFTVWDSEPGRNQIQFLGDSMFRGDITQSASIVNVGLASRVPTVCANALITAGYDIDWANLGVSGRQASVMLTSSQATSGTTNAFPQSTSDNTSSFGHSAFACRRTSAAKDIIVCLAGINDLSASGGNVSAATCQTRLEALRDAAQAEGFLFLICTIPNCDESKGIVGSGFNTKVDSVNSWILSNAGTFDGVVDMTGTATVHSNFSATYRNSEDGVHWTTTSMAIAAGLIQTELEALLGGVVGSPGFGIGSGIIGG